jgi:hypothetical protein
VIKLRNTTGVTIRATRPDDRERLVKAFRGLDPRSIYLRFLFHKKVQFEADVLAENTPMLNVLRHGGLFMTESEEDDIVHATLYLARLAYRTRE